VKKQRDRYEALKNGLETAMNEEKVARLDAVGFQWDVKKQRGCYRPICSHDADTATARKSTQLAKGTLALTGTSQHDGVDGETPCLFDRDSFNWCARASLGHSLSSGVGYGKHRHLSTHENDRGLPGTTAATTLVGVTNAFGSALESADRLKRHGPQKEVSGKSLRPAKVCRLKQGGPPPPQQPKKRGRLTARKLPCVGKISTAMEIVI
jgi:hypothetical protein